MLHVGNKKSFIMERDLGIRDYSKWESPDSAYLLAGVLFGDNNRRTHHSQVQKPPWVNVQFRQALQMQNTSLGVPCEHHS